MVVTKTTRRKELKKFCRSDRDHGDIIVTESKGDGEKKSGNEIDKS